MDAVGSCRAIWPALQPDVCHFTNSLAPLHAPCPIVITLHDMSLFVHARLHPLKSQLFVRPIIPAVARRAAAIITVSQHAKREIVAGLHLPPEKVHVIYEAAAPQYRVMTDAAELDRVRRRYQLTDRLCCTWAPSSHAKTSRASSPPLRKRNAES